MTKQQRFASRLRLSRLCRWILALGALKLTILAALILLPPEEEAPRAVLAGLPDDAAAPIRPAPEKRSLGSLLAESISVRGQIAHAAEVPPTEPVTPPAPRIRPNQSPFAQQPETNRPDEAVPGQAPAPAVSPFVPRDSAQRKQEELNRREQELLALQQQMQTRLDELKSLERKIQDMLKQANTVQDDKLKHLIDVYSNMKAKQAAEVLATLDERIAVRILAGMRGKQAGEILTYMQAEPAAKLSELLSRTQLPQ